MKLECYNLVSQPRGEDASVLVLVLWICLGLVSIALYFASSMTYELRAADNRANGLAAEQAIEGGSRYISYVLANYATNGAVPDPSQFKTAAVPVGNAKFWIIGRDPDPDNANASDPYFGLIDENSKINLNYADTNELYYLPNMSSDFAEGIVDWRTTNGMLSMDYSSAGYSEKGAGFESVDELRLVYGATMDLLAGDDINRNGILDKNEKDINGSGEVQSGLLEYTTVWTREPNFHSDGTTLTNVNQQARSSDLITLLNKLFQNDEVNNSSQMAADVARQVYPNQNSPAYVFKGLFDFAYNCRKAGMSADDFAKIADDVTTVGTTNAYIRGRINVNTANADVLTALFEDLDNGDESTAESAAQTLITYRQQNPQNIGSVAWVYDALGTGNTVLTALRQGDYITTHSFQFTADIAAVGQYGRGYRRTKFIFDVSDGTPKILYRQDLSRLGWALGEKVRTDLLAQNSQ